MPKTKPSRDVIVVLDKLNAIASNKSIMANIDTDDFIRTLKYIRDNCFYTAPEIIHYRWGDLTYATFGLINKHIKDEPANDSNWQVLLAAELCNREPTDVFNDWSKFKIEIARMCS